LGLTAADPFVYNRALGGAGLHPNGASYSNRSPQGLGKRDADALGLGAGGFIHQSRPGLPVFGLHHNGVGAFAHPVGKREAVEEPQKALATHPNGGTSYVGETVWGFPLEKRSADADAFYAPYGGVAAHPYGISYTQRTPQGLGKREAEEPALATHPNGGTSFVGRTVWGFPVEKREAGEEPALATHPNGGTSFVGSTVWGFPVEKREAGEEPALATHPNGGTSYVGETVWGFPAAKAVEKRDAEVAVAYSNRSPQGAYGLPAPYFWG